ncbi:MAG: hypothetical protein IT269_00215 [Saprospiraceae bacterium]|nr:hypothetical protein [Saprospiraceae bacterium]
MRKLALILCLVPIALLTACDNEAEKNQQRKEWLSGHWELQEAMRNDKPTLTLSGTFFDFGADGQMTTNLPLSEQDSTVTTYELTPKTIQQQGDFPLTYEIIQLSQTDLSLKTEIQGMVFNLKFKKQ